MQFKFHAENTTITEAIAAYAQDKLSALDKYQEVADETMTVNVKVYPDKNTKFEATVKDFHAEATDRDLYAAIDIVEEKLDKQLRKAKTKRLKFQQDRTAVKHNF